MKSLSNRRGVTLISAVVAAVIVAGSAFIAFSALNQSRGVSLGNSEQLVAQLWASELAEFFRGHHSSALLKTYLQTNPVGGANPYPLCSHINILDRVSKKIANPDPLAELPPQSGLNEANRFYQVHVVNLDTLQIVKSPYCSQTATAAVLGANERFLVTVGVSWLPRSGGTTTEVRRVVQSTIVPRS